MRPATRTRYVRALTLASASFGLGIAGHVEAGGHSGTTGSLYFGAAFCALSGWALAGRRLSAPAVAGVLLANQVVMHVAMVLGTPHDASSMGTASMAAMGPDCDLPAASPAMSLVPGGWMILAHVVASALAAAAIVVTEAVWLGLTALARWIARVLRVVLGAPTVHPRQRLSLSSAAPLRSGRIVGARPGRGPPSLRLSW